MGASLGGDDEVMSDINIIPFVDIVLVVLIIFMVTTTTALAPTAMKVNLPDAATGEASEQVSLGLTLTREGHLLLDGERATPEQVKAAIREARAEGSEVVCLIAADKLTAHGRVVWLMDLVNSEGARFHININRADAVPPDPESLGEGRALEGAG